MRTPNLLWLVAALLLTACGAGDDPDIASTSHVLVAVHHPGDLEAVVVQAGGRLLDPIPGTSYWRVAVPTGTSVSSFRRALQGDGRVLHAELDLALSAPEGDRSTLPAGGLLPAPSVPDQDELLRIGADVARTRATGHEVRVAVLDSGVTPHVLLDGRVDEDGWDLVDDDPDPQDERNGIDDDRDGLFDEGFGHGTFVASLILAVAPDARIVPFRVLDSDGVGSASVLATAVSTAVDRGVDVINLSVGMPERVDVLQEAVHRARQLGVLVIASAGNTGGDDVNFPSALTDAVSVTSVDTGDRLALFASYGGEVDLSAPGVELLGAFPPTVFPSGTARWSGTSFSAALVTGACALLRELYADEDEGTIRVRLMQGLVPASAEDPRADPRMGEGRVALDLVTAP